ncbi:MAG: glucose 1-dehydrogenase [Anaerolineae bacterium]|nr:glucose 1-dehydrogenase [Anaerolineae bacterium]
MRLQDQVAIVTGAGRGIGRGIALRLAEEGANITVADVLNEEAEETGRLIGELERQALILKVDVSKRLQVEQMVAETLAAFGKIDVLVNNAGVIRQRALVDMTEEEWDWLMGINLKGPFLCSQAVVRYFLKAGVKGKIVNIASIESEIVFPDSAAYAASKGGVAMLTKAMAYDLAMYGINVNAVGPGSTDTGRNFQDPERLRQYQEMIPMRRLATPRDIGSAVVYLASAEADYVTGHILYVDGGFLTY